MNPFQGMEQFVVARDRNREDLHHFKRTMNTIMPSGGTPLTRHINAIRQCIQAKLPYLTQGQRVAVIIATDGLPSDDLGASGQIDQDNFIAALKSLEKLPVWIVIRLCSDEKEVIRFYYELDSQLELSIQVLQDFRSEARKVQKHNKYINYHQSLHRCREMGFHSRLFNLINQRSLTLEELKEFLIILFGEEKYDGFPDPTTDWKLFVKKISNINTKEKKRWNPISCYEKRLISIWALKRQFADDICAII